MVEPHSSNFRVITTNFLGVRIFRKFTVSINALIEPQHDKTNKMTCAPGEDSRSAWASAQSDQSHCCPHEETLSP